MEFSTNFIGLKFVTFAHARILFSKQHVASLHGSTFSVGLMHWNRSDRPRPLIGCGYPQIFLGYTSQQLTWRFVATYPTLRLWSILNINWKCPVVYGRHSRGMSNFINIALAVCGNLEKGLTTYIRCRKLQTGFHGQAKNLGWDNRAISYSSSQKDRLYWYKVIQIVMVSIQDGMVYDTTYSEWKVVPGSRTKMGGSLLMMIQALRRPNSSRWSSRPSVEHPLKTQGSSWQLAVSHS